MSAARTWLMTFLMLVAGGGVGVGLAAATSESSASPPPPSTPTTSPPAQVVPTTVATPQSGDAGRGRHNGFDGSIVKHGPFGNVVLPPGHLAKSHGRSATPTTQPPATTPTTDPNTTTPTTQPHTTTTTSPTTTPPGGR